MNEGKDGFWLTDMGNVNSSTSVIGTLRSNPCAGDGDVDYWGVVDIWDDYQLYHVLSGGAGLLGPLDICGSGRLVMDHATEGKYDIL